MYAITIYVFLHWKLHSREAQVPNLMVFGTKFGGRTLRRSEVDERRRVPFYIWDFIPYLQGIPLHKELSPNPKCPADCQEIPFFTSRARHLGRDDVTFEMKEMH
jgi:hypothetical protein